MVMGDKIITHLAFCLFCSDLLVFVFFCLGILVCVCVCVGGPAGGILNNLTPHNPTQKKMVVLVLYGNILQRQKRNRIVYE